MTSSKYFFVFTFKFNLTLKVKLNHPTTQFKVFYTAGLNLVILTFTGHELSRGQARDCNTDRQTDGRTDGRTDRQPQAMTIPGGQKNVAVKMTIHKHWTEG